MKAVNTNERRLLASVTGCASNRRCGRFDRLKHAGQMSLT